MSPFYEFIIVMDIARPLNSLPAQTQYQKLIKGQKFVKQNSMLLVSFARTQLPTDFSFETELPQRSWQLSLQLNFAN